MSQQAEHEEIKKKILTTGIRVGTEVKTKFMIPYITQANPEVCPARTVIIYAWNEHDEGGWLCPTWSPDGRPDRRRLEAIRKVLKP